MTLKELVERYCVMKLANILWECVACSDGNRAELDWLTAERFIKDNPPIVDQVLQAFISTMPQPCGVSGETAVGKFPAETVRMMSKIIEAG